MTIEFVDFHCHLDLFDDHEQIVTDCEKGRIYTLAVTTTPRAWPRNRALTASTRYVRASLGLHPQLVGERATELRLWRDYLKETRYVGEVGLDASPRFFPTLALQKEVFTNILVECARRGGKTLSVHSVRTAKTVLDLIEKHLPSKEGRIVLHWFTGTKAEARRAAEMGCYFSINWQMLRSPRHETLVADLPLERLLTETDGPFTETNGRPTRPTDVAHTVAALARARRAEPANMAATIRGNLRVLLSV